MTVTAQDSSWRFWMYRFGVVFCLTMLGLVNSCSLAPPADNTNDNTSDGTGGVTGTIVSFSSNIGISELDPPVSVIYSVTGTPDSVSGFYVRVADASPDAAPTGPRNVIAEDLPAGTNQFFNFDPGVAGVGFFRVGIIMQVGSDETVAESEGVVQVQGRPDPIFVRPAGGSTDVQQGTDVEISFDAGDPEGDVQWRLFYLSETDSRDNPPDQLGTQIGPVGSGNVGAATLSTDGMAPGEYELGLSATDSGLSVASTVEAGELERIVTIPNAETVCPVIRVLERGDVFPPTLTFTAPGASDVYLFRDEAYTLRFTAEVSEPGATGVIELFYDDDATVSNGFRATLTEDEIPASTTSYPLRTDLPEGAWHIGGTVRTTGGVSPTVTAYATGRVVVVREPTLTVTKPDSSLPVPPATPVPVTWTTTMPGQSADIIENGRVDVFARTVDASGAPYGPEIPILTGGAVLTTSATFTTSTPGLYQITVRLEYEGATVVTGVAPRNVRISSLPRILWIGSLIDDDPPFEGAIFGGVNFEDNAGTSLSAVGDLDVDGLDDFAIGSRYGKPFFVNPSGIGPGEAYILYGAQAGAKLVGEYNLNSVGTSALRGIILTGIPTVGNSSDTDGLSDITTIPDADGDGLDELAFGFPRTDSAGFSMGELEADGQFLNGGVVILSSDSSLLRDPPAVGGVIALVEVGQGFSDMTVTFPPGVTCLADRWRFQPGDPPTCITGSDTVLDTIVGPGTGFISLLAPPCWVQRGFEIYTGSPAPNLCPTRDDLRAGACVPSPFSFEESGSGFYPSTATSLEPNGARIIGPSEGDRFGTSVTASKAVSGTGSVDLIISAPNRTASASEIEGISGDIAEAGVAFLTNNRNLWSAGTSPLPPSPHQYVMDVVSHCGDNRASSLDALGIAGDTGDKIENVLGIDDFNGDGRNDFAVGAPNAGSGQGRLYIAYRREEAVEGDFVLNKLERDPTDPERLDGMLIVTSSLDGLGASLATGFDFNHDGVSDLVVGSPNASGGVGEVVIIFGDPGIISPANGISVANLLSTQRTSAGGAVAARIKGNPLDVKGQFGFNVANAGDVDGDGFADLLVAAPGASPRFDPAPNDGTDKLSDNGLDLDFDGVKDDVSGTTGQPDGKLDSEDDLLSAGIVYLIFGSNRLDEIPADDFTINIDQLGKSILRGLMVVGWHTGDRLGGGDAGEADSGGLSGKLGRGRSNGLASGGDIDGDGRADILVGAVLADPRRDPNTGVGVQNGGEAYVVYGTVSP